MVKENHEISDSANIITEDNILKGDEKPFNGLIYNTGQAILNVLNNKLNHVSQIDAKTGMQTTFAEMKDRSVRCALWMEKQGISSNDIVVICSHNHLDAYVPVFATFYVGAVYNAWNHTISLESARYLMQLLTPKLLFSCESSVGVLMEAAKLENVDTKFIVFGEHSNLQSVNTVMEQQVKDEVKNFVPQVIKDPNKLAAIIMSSGSTGLPKGIMFSHKALLENVYFDIYSLKNSVMIWHATLFWITGFLWTLYSLFHHITKIIHDKPEVEDTCKVIEKYKIGIAFLSPVLLAYIAKSDAVQNYDLSCLRKIITGGSKPNKEVLEILQRTVPNAVVLQGHGMTETGRCCIYQAEHRKRIDSVGFILTNTQMKIVDLTSGKALGPNKLGELCFKSSSMMLGYYKNPEATKQAFDEEGWLHSGDQAYYDEDGEVFIFDRLGEIIKYKDHNISPTEIEQALMAHPAVAEVAVVPVPHEVDGEWPMAFVKKIIGSHITEEELVELSSTLGELKRLRGGVVFMAELPKTGYIKVARNELKKMARNLVQKSEY